MTVTVLSNQQLATSKRFFQLGIPTPRFPKDVEVAQRTYNALCDCIRQLIVNPLLPNKRLDLQFFKDDLLKLYAYTSEEIESLVKHLVYIGIMIPIDQTFFVDYPAIDRFTAFSIVLHSKLPNDEGTA